VRTVTPPQFADFDRYQSLACSKRHLTSNAPLTRLNRHTVWFSCFFFWWKVVLIDTFLDFSLLPPDAPAFVLQKPPIIFRVIFVTTVITSGLLIFLSVLAAGQYWKPAAERFSPFNKLADPSLRKLWNRVVLKLTVVLAFFNIAIGKPSIWLSLHNYSFLFTGPLSYKLMDLYYRTMRQHFIAFVSARHPDITANIGTTPTCESQSILIAWNRLI